MRAVVQRVSDASVTVDDRLVGSIERGLLVYVGAGKNDASDDAEWLARKVANLRVFEDEAGLMNRSVLDEGGRVLAVSQFTLFADARKGRRPSYSDAASPEIAKPLFDGFVAALGEIGLRVATGEFGASMRVAYVNEGPVTILLDSKKTF
ncbi:MAG: D-tyrosyl-tRNA(Tyr) deacylase [Spirochaetales bacterium]|nr:D-tyrosyl-tRNA(Tyr) deacylase [Spirochaetales bacterium]